jgi:CheY-like chemotaxis protein
MARVVALVPDLLFGSKLQGMLAAAGHDVALVSSPEGARAAAGGIDLLVVDLFSDSDVAIALVEGMRADGTLGGARVLAAYAHTAPEVRAAALAAGFDLVVPRSRMAREGAALADRLLSASAR